MSGSRCSRDDRLNRTAWTTKEDMILRDYINIHGLDGGWRSVRDNTGLNRSGKSCRLRWMDYLRPNIKRGNISTDEDELIIRLHRLLGNRWSLIAGRLPGRTGNEIKNYWNTYLKKKIGTLNKRDRIEANVTEEDFSIDPVGANQTAVNIENNITDAQVFDEQSTTLLNEDLTMEICSRHRHNMMSLIFEDQELIFEHNGITSQAVLDLDCAVQFPYIDFQMSYLCPSVGHA